MVGKALSDLVSDWGGFERLVAQLHETGTVKVEHDVTLPGRSGAPRQIDVLVRHTEGLYEHLIVVECKYRNSAVERLHVDALATTIREVGASRGVIFSVEGFQSGAIDQARHENISLFLLREPTDPEWGLPGRHVDIWLHFISCSLSSPELPGAMVLGPPLSRPPNLNLQLDWPEPKSKTPVKVTGQPDATLEELLLRLVRKTAEAAYKPAHIGFEDGFNGEVKRVIQTKFAPETPMTIVVDGHLLVAPQMNFMVGLKVSQSRLQIDRAERFAFVLAVEDCVRSGVKTATRVRDSAVTQLADLDIPAEGSTEAAWQNGSIITVWIGPLEPWSEFDGLEPCSGPEVKMKL